MRSFVRKRPLLAVAIVALVLAGSAVAAFLVYSKTIGGTVSGGQFTATTTTLDALLVESNGSPSGDFTPGGSDVTIPVKITNKDSAAHSIITDNITTSTPSVPSCASSLTVVTATAPLLPSAAYTAGEQKTATFTVSVDPNTPSACAGVPVTFNFAGTTD